MPFDRNLDFVAHRGPDLLDRLQAALEIVRVQIVADRPDRADAGATPDRAASETPNWSQGQIFIPRTPVESSSCASSPALPPIQAS